MLTRERVVRAAVELADADGIAALTMRKLGAALGVEAMSLYHHVSGKGDLVDGMVDALFAEIALPEGDGWRAALRARAVSARATLARHPWAIGLMESRIAPGPATLRQHDAVLGVLRGAGFAVPLSAHVFALLDSYVYGFALQEATLPFRNGDEVAAVVEQTMGRMDPDEYPHLHELALTHVLSPGYDFGDEFAYGLDLLLDGVERARALGSGACASDCSFPKAGDTISSGSSPPTSGG